MSRPYFVRNKTNKTMKSNDGKQASPPVARLPINVPHPKDLQVNNVLKASVQQLQDQHRPKNSIKSQCNKVAEFYEFCDFTRPDDLHKYSLDYDKVYSFMWFQSFREKRPRGGDKELKKRNIIFDSEIYQTMMDESKNGNHMLCYPSNPIGPATFNQYKACFRRIFKEQMSKEVNSRHWDQIWQVHLDDLARAVKERGPRIKKETYQEKVSGEFAPYAIVERYGEIENELWQDSNCSAARSIATNLRHRYCLLHLTSGVLRCESLHRAELSDFMSLRAPMKDTDVHQMYLMINQIAFGKTNHGRLLYGRATRHKQVEMCCIGALSFYLSFRFFCTKEFENFTVDDWMDNSSWFDVKLLADIQGDNMKVIQSDSYGNHIKSVLMKLNIVCDKLLHLGRNMESKILDLLEEESESIRRMGQWNPNIFDASYSSKLPMGPIRKLAGYSSSSKFYYNTRTTVDPPEECLNATPLGGWVYQAYKDLTSTPNGSKNQTALHVLDFFRDLNKIFLQDAAALVVKHPARAEHTMFRMLPVFEMHAFLEYVNKMELALQNEDDSLDANLEKVLPGIHQWHNANNSAIKKLEDGIVTLYRVTKEGFEEAATAAAESRQESNARLAEKFMSIAQNLLEESKGGTPSPRKIYAPTQYQPTQDKDQGSNEPSPPLLDTSTLRFTMKRKHNSLRDMWDEWHGLGPFSDPCDRIAGGIPAREAMLGKSWRKLLPNQHYSRTNRIIKMLTKTIVDGGGCVDDATDVAAALEKHQPMFDNCKGSISAIVKVCQECGLIEKKEPRGRGVKRSSREITIGDGSRPSTEGDSEII